MKRNFAHIITLCLFAASLFLLVACSDSATESTDGDSGAVGRPCATDSDCESDISNLTCNTLEGICIDHGLCQVQNDCQRLYGLLKPYCAEDGICSASDKPDGDTGYVDGDTGHTDGDTFTDGDSIVPDGDNAGSGDDDWTPPLDGDWDYDFTDPDVDVDLAPFVCNSAPTVNVPTLAVTPNSADFGAVSFGEYAEIHLELCNSSGVDLSITGIKFSRQTSPEFSKIHEVLPFVLPAGYAAPVALFYIPVDNTQDSGNLEILSNDPNNPMISIPLIASIKAAPYLETNPRVLQFSGATSGQTLSKLLEIKNIGTASTSILALQVEGGSASPYKVLEVMKNNQAVGNVPWMLAPQEAIMVTVAMTMAETSVDDNLIITWITDSGERHTAVIMTTGNVAMCAEPNAGLDQVVDPLSIVNLDGSMSFDPNGTVLAYKWEWENKPPEAYRAEIIDSNGINIEGVWSQEQRPTFYAELAGTYLVKLTLKDDESTCTGVNQDIVNIWAKPASTVHIQLLWENSTNDQDLHLIKPGGHHTREDGGNTTDCHYTNCNTYNGTASPCPFRGCPGPFTAPDWGTMNQRFDDPFLDIDDVPGNGPENINLDAPELGEYMVNIEQYSGGANDTVKVKIFLFGVPEMMFTLDSSRSMDEGERWNVCKLKVVDATTIEIIAVDTVQ